MLEFLLERARFVLREKSGYAYDEVNAVLRAGCDDLVDVEKRLRALKAIRKSKNFEPLAVSFKRIRRILEKANLGRGSAAASTRNSSRKMPSANCTRRCARPQAR